MLAQWPFLNPCHNLGLGNWYWPRNLRPNTYGIPDSQKVPSGSVCNPDIPTPEGDTDADTGAKTGVYTAELVILMVT